MMELYVFDKDVNALGMIEYYYNLRWLTEYNGLGEFQLIAKATEENIALLKLERILWKNDSDVGAVIESIKINKDIECRGRLTNKYLTERIALKAYSINNIEQDLRKLIEENAILNRPIRKLALGKNNNFAENRINNFKFKELDAIINSYPEFGYKLVLDIVNKKHKFELYKGQDLSNNIVFSEEFDNIIDTVINLEDKDYKNFAIVGGRGEGKARKIVNVDIRNGNDLRELWVDAKDVEESYYIEEGGEEVEVFYTDEEMNDILRNRGLEKLAEYVIINDFKATLVSNGNYIYKQDYNLGDIVTCKSVVFNIQLKVRIEAIQEVYDSSGYSVLIKISNYLEG